MVGVSSSVVTFFVASVICAEVTVPSIAFSVTAAVEVLSAAVAVVGFAVLGTSAFIVVPVRGSVESDSFSLEAVVTGVSDLTSLFTSTAAVVSVSVATDVVVASVVSRTYATVLIGVAVSVTTSVYTSVSASVRIVEAFGFLSVSIMTCTGTFVVVVSIVAAVVAFSVSRISFVVVALPFVGSLTSVVIFFVALLVCTGGTVLSFSFFVTAPV